MADEVIVSGEFRTTAKPKSMPYESAQFVGRLDYSAVDGTAMFEGDIILATEEEAEAAHVRDTLRTLGQMPLETMKLPKELVDALVDFAKPGALEAAAVIGLRWPDRVIPFIIDPGLPEHERVTEAIAHWEKETAIKFRKKTEADVNWVRFASGSGCASSVGCRGGEQKIILGPQCTAGNAIHEIGHTVGLWHEQSRKDRGTFIEIDLENVISGTEHNFLQHISDGDDIGKYDFESIMHYPLDAFALDPTKPTIIPIKPVPQGVTVGQRKALSAGDIAAVAAMYP